MAPAPAANQPSRFRVVVEDNGPGIVKPQIPKIFAKLLYGSKFHRLKQSRGQQGIGISAAGLYGQLTTGKPVVITSKTGQGPTGVQDRSAHRHEAQPARRREGRDGGLGEGARDPRRDRARRGLPRRADGRAGVPGADGRREPAPGADVRVAQGRAPGVPARVERAAARGAGDQAAPPRRRARDAADDAGGLAGQDGQAGAVRRLLARVAGGGAAGLPDGQGEPQVAGGHGCTARTSSGCTRRSAR